MRGNIFRNEIEDKESEINECECILRWGRQKMDAFVAHIHNYK